MGRYVNSRSLIVILPLLLLILLFLLLGSVWRSDVDIEADVWPTDMELGRDMTFADSTRKATAWLWEFGDGETSDARSGRYRYKLPGRYRIRLTANGHATRLFTVQVRPRENREEEMLARIQAPQSALQGEHVVFRGIGSDKEWRWEFGESGRVDARDKQSLYAYSEPGIYEVLLSTENTRYPVRHTIEILPTYSETDSTDVLVLIGLDIQEKLQRIADGKPFNANYNYVLTKYLNDDPHTPITINNTKYNDFYTYCQGLRHSGRGTTVIETVIVETEDEQSSYIHKMTVLQREKRR